MLAMILFLFSIKSYCYSAKVIFLKGRLNNSETSLKLGDQIKEGEKLSTQSSSIAKIRYTSGGTLTLGSNTQIVLSSPKKSSIKVIDLIKGNIRAKFSKTNRLDYKFKVYTKSAALGIRGTEILITYNEKNNISSAITLSGEADFITMEQELYNNTYSLKESMVSSSTGQSFAPTKQQRIDDKQLNALKANHATTETKGAYIDIKSAIVIPYTEALETGSISKNGKYIPPKGLVLHPEKGFQLDSQLAEEDYDDSIFNKMQFAKIYRKISTTNRKLENLVNKLNERIYSKYLKKIDNFVKSSRILSRFTTYSKLSINHDSVPHDYFYESVIKKKSSPDIFSKLDFKTTYTKKYKTKFYLAPELSAHKTYFFDTSGFNKKELDITIAAGFDKRITSIPYKLEIGLSKNLEYRHLKDIQNVYINENEFFSTLQVRPIENFILTYKYKYIDYKTLSLLSGHFRSHELIQNYGLKNHAMELTLSYKNRKEIKSKAIQVQYLKRNIISTVNLGLLYSYKTIDELKKKDTETKSTVVLEKSLNRYLKLNTSFSDVLYISQREISTDLNSKTVSVGLSLLY